MAFIESLMKLLSSLFGGFKEPAAQTAEQPKPVSSFKLKMSDATFAFMTSSESEDTKSRFRGEMEEFERKGTYKYDLMSEKWLYHVDNGQFRAAPIGPKV